MVRIALLDKGEPLPEHALGQNEGGAPLVGARESGHATHFGIQYECAGCYQDMPRWPSGWWSDEVRYRAYCPDCRQHRVTVIEKDGNDAS